MAKPKLTVVTEYGTFTRQTARDYKFVVASRNVSAETLAKYHAAQIAHAEKEIVEYQAVLDSGVVPAQCRVLTLDHFRKFVVDLTARVQRLQAEQHDWQAESQKVYEHGWSSRRDLAEKVAAEAVARGYQGVKVFEVK